MAQAGGKDASKLGEALEAAWGVIETQVKYKLCKNLKAESILGLYLYKFTVYFIFFCLKVCYNSSVSISNGCSTREFFIKEGSTMTQVSQETMMFKRNNENKDVSQTISEVCKALEEKGYNPIDQLVGYLLSGDPTYITSHDDARTKLRRFERYELIEELVVKYLEKNTK